MNERPRLVIDFVVFLVNRLARAWGMTTPETYAVLDASGAMGSYILPNWEVLHAEGAESLVPMMTDYVTSRGVVL